MSQCANLLVRCMDFRLHQVIEKWLREKKYIGNTDLLSVAGSCKSLTVYPFSSESRYLMAMIELAISKHGVKTIILTQHQDCLAYGGQAGFATPEDEKKCLINDLKKVREILKQKQSGLTVLMFLLKFQDEMWQFEEILD